MRREKTHTRPEGQWTPVVGGMVGSGGVLAVTTSNQTPLSPLSQVRGGNRDGQADALPEKWG